MRSAVETLVSLYVLIVLIPLCVAWLIRMRRALDTLKRWKRETEEGLGVPPPPVLAAVVIGYGVALYAVAAAILGGR